MVQCSRVILYPVMNIIHYEFQFILQNAYYTDNKVNELFSVRKGKKTDSMESSRKARKNLIFVIYAISVPKIKSIF